MRQELSLYRLPSTWDPGSIFIVRTLWFCLFGPITALRFLPGSFWRVLLLRLFGARIGSSCRIMPGFRLKFPWRFVVGDHCWLGESAWVDNLAPVIIGDRVCISQGVYICTGNHDFRSTTFDLKLGSIYIESDVWVASFSILCPGTHLGSSCVIFAGSVVNGVIPEGSLVRGNPYSIIGQR